MPPHKPEKIVGLGLVLFFMVLPGIYFGVRWARTGARTLERYRSHAPGEFERPIVPYGLGGVDWLHGPYSEQVPSLLAACCWT